MTTHKSKGLEFPVVFVIALGRKMSGQAMRARVLMDAEPVSYTHLDVYKRQEFKITAFHAA